MNTKQKKALYESIMKSVAKTIKKNLNESKVVDEPIAIAQQLLERLEGDTEAINLVYELLTGINFCLDNELDEIEMEVPNTAYLLNYTTDLFTIQ